MIPPKLIPDPDYDDPKELYAFFGLTFYKAQVLEQGIVNLAVALQAKGICPLTVGDVLQIYERYDKKTLGSVLKAARSLTAIPESMDSDLKKALQIRNHLAHRFFVDHSEHMLTAKGCGAMLDELREMLEFLATVDEEFDKIWMAAWNALGVTQKWFDQQFEKARRDILTDQTL